MSFFRVEAGHDIPDNVLVDKGDDAAARIAFEQRPLFIY